MNVSPLYLILVLCFSAAVKGASWSLWSVLNLQWVPGIRWPPLRLVCPAQHVSTIRINKEVSMCAGILLMTENMNILMCKCKCLILRSRPGLSCSWETLIETRITWHINIPVSKQTPVWVRWWEIKAHLQMILDDQKPGNCYDHACRDMNNQVFPDQCKLQKLRTWSKAG